MLCDNIIPHCFAITLFNFCALGKPTRYSFELCHLNLKMFVFQMSTVSTTSSTVSTTSSTTSSTMSSTMGSFETMLSTRNCGSKVCDQVHIFREKCPIFVGTPPRCDPPCEEEGCQIQFEHNVVCSEWRCHEMPTTSTESPMPTIAPEPARYFKTKQFKF